MVVRLSKRMDILRASDIREILKVTQHPEVISFAGGLPAPELFPVLELEEITRDILRDEGARALQYSTTEGFPPLREKIAARMNAKWATDLVADEVLITTGSQQGLDLIGKLFLDDGDAVLCESPTYLGAITAWNVFRPRWVEVPTDDDGMDLDGLERSLDANPHAKFIYVVPNFQNPSGRTWSLERRLGLMRLAASRGVPVVEDNPYGELRFEGESHPAIQSFDEKGLVLSLGTFSKIFCPGLRIGWVAARRTFYEKLVILKQGTDLHTSSLNQVQVARYMERYDLEANVKRTADLYRERRDAMIRALEREMPAEVSFTRPEGGLFLWVELPDGVSARDVLAKSLERGVAFVPGGAFFPNGGRENTLRLNFSNMPPARIEEGVKRLAEVLTPLISNEETEAAAETATAPA
jgi:2-aminoadipate transaminase